MSLQPTHLNTIEGEVKKVNDTLDNMSTIVAKHKAELFDILKDDLAEKDDDEKDLNTLQKTLEEKKDKFTEDLGKKKTNGIDLKDNTELVSFWNTQIKTIPEQSLEVTDSDRDAIRNRIPDVLSKLVYLDFKGDNLNKARQLFKSKTLNVTKIDEVLEDADMVKILESNTDAELQTNIDTLVSKVAKTQHDFYIQPSKLYEREKEGKIALRIAIFLYQIYNLTKNKKKQLPEATRDKIINMLKQIEEKDIPQIKGIYNVKKELDKVIPLHDTLHDINQKQGNVNLGNKDLTHSFTHDVTSDFEHGKAVDLDKYEIKKDNIRIGGYNVKLLGSHGDRNEFVAKKGEKDVLEVQIEIGGIFVTVGKLTLNNKKEGSVCDIVWEGKPENKDALGAIWPLELEMDIKGIKNIKDGLGGSHAGLTKTYKFSLLNDIDDDDDIKVEADKEETASLSNVTNISREQAERQAEEKLRKRYKDLPWYSPDRVNLFFRRQLIKEKLVARELRGRSQFQRDEQNTDAADRHLTQEDTLGDTSILNPATIDATTYPSEHAQINKLVRDFVGAAPFTSTPMTDAQFQLDFQRIVSSPAILALMRYNDMKEVSSNILMRVKSFKAHQGLVTNILDEVNKGKSDDDFSRATRPLIAKYIRDYGVMPEFLKTLKVNLDDVADQVKKLNSHKAALTAIQAQTLNMKVKILNKGEGAYHVDQKSQGWLTKVGKRLDMPFASWVQKKPDSAFRRTVSGIVGKTVQIGSVVGAGIVGGAIAGPLGTAAAVGSTVGFKTLFAKFSHYTKEHKGQMKNQAVDMDNYRSMKTALTSAFSSPTFRDRFKKDYKHFKRYIATTHDNLIPSKDQANRIEKFVQKDMLTVPEQNQLREDLAETLARLDRYRNLGQNFLGSNKYEVAEQEFQKVHQLLLTGMERLYGGTGASELGRLRTDGYYKAIESRLNVDYQDAARKFRRMRRKQGYLHAAKAGAIAGGLSYGASKLLSTEGGPDTDTYMKRDDYNFAPGVNEESALIKGDFSSDLGSCLSDTREVTPGVSELELVVSPGVDALPTNPVAFTSSTLQAKINTVLTSSEYASLSPVNQATVINALDASNSSSMVSEMLKHAASQSGVDTGNQYLFAMRGVESVEHMVKEMVNTECQTNPLHLSFDASNAVADASVSGSSGDTAHRTMNALLKVTDDVSGVNRAIPIPIVDNTFKRHEGRV